MNLFIQIEEELVCCARLLLPFQLEAEFFEYQIFSLGEEALDWILRGGCRRSGSSAAAAHHLLDEAGPCRLLLLMLLLLLLLVVAAHPEKGEVRRQGCGSWRRRRRLGRGNVVGVTVKVVVGVGVVVLLLTGMLLLDYERRIGENGRQAPGRLAHGQVADGHRGAVEIRLLLMLLLLSVHAL